ncbi:MAG: dihydrodipicolinate synthase family protein, partial [Nitrospinales bacterium]
MVAACGLFLQLPPFTIRKSVTESSRSLPGCGSAEAATHSHAEHRQVVEIVVREASSRVPGLAGPGAHSTPEALEL